MKAIMYGAYNMCKEQNVDSTFIQAGIGSEDILKNISRLSDYDKVLEIKKLFEEKDVKSVLEELK